MRLAGLLALSALLSACGPKGREAVIARGEQRASDAAEVLDEAERALNAGKLDDAQKALKEARELVTDPSLATHPEQGMLRQRLEDDERRMPVVREALARKALEERIAKAKEAVEASLGPLPAAVQALRSKALDRDRTSAAKKAVGAVQAALASAKELEVDRGWADFAAGVRKRLDAAGEELGKAEQVLSFVEGPVSGRIHGDGALASARRERDPERRVQLLEEASDRYRECAAQGKQALSAQPELKAVRLPASALAPSADAAIAACEKKAAEAAKQLAAARKALPGKKKGRR